jgi:hypothetical protein
MAKQMNGTTEPTENFSAILLASIIVDKSFNARHIGHEKDAASDENQERGTAKGIESLSYSIEDEGQDTPIKVRLNTEPKTKDKFPYRLVAGFRRVAALEMIVSRALANNLEHPIKKDPTWSAKAPTVKAIVKNMTETEALLENMRENTARDDLSGADLAFGVHRLMQQYKKEKGGERGGPRAIARGLGKDERYVGKLLTIMDTLESKITDHWRTSMKPLPVATLFDLTDEKKYRPEERFEKYNAFCGGANPNKPPTEAKDPMEAMCESVAKTANFLGRLHEMEFINCDDAEWGTEGFLRELGTIKPKVVGKDPKKWKQLGRAARDGFEQGRKDVRAEAEKAAKKAAAGNDDEAEETEAETEATAN